MIQFTAPGVRKQQYSEFLKTDFWKSLSRQCLQRDKFRCRECFGKTHLQAHHKFYRPNWFDTELDDLITLCVGCHRREHGINKHHPIMLSKKAKHYRKWLKRRKSFTRKMRRRRY